jgi:FKBP-type peptidyl-prolyl cis-trans isomerase 2
MTQIKQNDFVLLEFTAKIKDGGEVFDTSNEEVAKESGIHNPQMPYGQYIICVGKSQILPKLEEFLVGKDLEKEYTVELQPEDAFGKKDAKLLKLVPTKFFTKENIQPVAGLQVNIDGQIGRITTVTGGRTIVDFNHPLSSKEVIYTLKPNKIIEDAKEKVKAYLRTGYSLEGVDVEIKEKSAKIKVDKKIIESLNDEVKKELEKDIIGAIEELDKIEFLEKDNKQ